MMKASFKIKDYGARAAPVAVVLFVVLFAIFGSLFGPPLRNIFVSVVAPSEEGEYALLSRGALIARLSDAESELTRIRYQAALYGLIAEENVRLRDAANAVKISGGVGVTGRVISRPPQTIYDSLLLDAGGDRGVSAGDLVVFENVALGRVVAVTERSATVRLFSSPGSSQDVLVGSPVAVSTARGLGGGAFELSVPQSVTVEKGDTVRLPGTEAYALGVVADISSTATDVSKLVRFSGVGSLADFDFVRIITEPPQ